MADDRALADALRDVLAGDRLDSDRVRGLFETCLDGEADPVALGGLLVALAQRGETADEVAGVAGALRSRMEPFAHDHPDAIDTCGTGGDGLGTFNVSTASAIVVAAAGGRVVKHGNRAVSSKCGSADLLERVGVAIDVSPETARACLEQTGITFLFAPRYHAAMRHAAPVRRALGVRTIFNLVGPLANPGGVRRQVLGVSEPRLLELHALALERQGAERALVVHGAGGADELTLAGPNEVRVVGATAAPSFDAAALGIANAPVDALAGGDVGENVTLLGRVLAGEPSPIADAVCLNAAAGLWVGGVAADAAAGLAAAREAVASGAAKATLERWIRISRTG